MSINHPAHRVPSATAGGRRQTGGIVRIAGCQELS
jgi:hypothetical protein